MQTEAEGYVLSQLLWFAEIHCGLHSASTPFNCFGPLR